MTAQSDKHEDVPVITSIDQPLLRNRNGRRGNPLRFISKQSGPFLKKLSDFDSHVSNAENALETTARVLTHVYWAALLVFVVEIVLTACNVNLWRIDWWGGLGNKESEFLHHGVMTLAAFTWWFTSTVKISINSFLKRWGLLRESFDDMRLGMDPLGFSILFSGWRLFGGMVIWVVWSVFYFCMAVFLMYVVVSIISIFI